MKYFIGNWKMFGVPKSINILNKINSFHSRDKNRKKYRVIFTPPYTLIENYAKHFKNKRISIGSQNCYQKDQFSSNTAAVSPYMIRSVGAKYTLVGHSDNRSEGDTNTMLKNKVMFALKNDLKIKDYKIKDVKQNEVFSEEIIKRIFLTDDNQIDLITNNTVTKNYLVLIIKTDYKDLNPKSNEYEQYEAKARLNLINKIYLSHDRNLNSKYKVELNQRTIERVKNSF